MIPKIKGYYFITDAGLSLSGNERDVIEALKSGVTVIQYRDKGRMGRDALVEASRLRKLCKRALFIVNDRVDIALACGADGVHLGQDDIPCRTARKLLGKKRIIGVTARSVAEARKAVLDGADYVAVSPVFKTGTKEDAGEPVGIELIKKIKKLVKTPLVAIGGINLYNARGVIIAGADAVCAISCVVTKKDVSEEIKKFQRLYKR